MIRTAGLILFIVPALLAAKVPGCDENNNNGVFNEFGNLPDKIFDAKLYQKVLKGDKPYMLDTSKPSLKEYSFENAEFKENAGTSTLSYYKIMLKDKDQFRVIDSVRVDPAKFDKLEDAILEADEAPSKDSKIRIKFLLSDCTCVMRTYDLNTDDIVQQATSSSCDEKQQVVIDPLTIDISKILSLKAPSKMEAGDVFSRCDPKDNFGVMYQFGPLPSALKDTNLYKPAQDPESAEKMLLYGRLYRYKVEFHKYTSVKGAGGEAYEYLTLYFWDQFQSTYKVLDYLKVQVGKWKEVQQAIVDGDYTDIGGMVSVKFKTSDCRCVKRSYSLDAADTPAEAKTSACNGDPIQTPPHPVPL